MKIFQIHNRYKYYGGEDAVLHEEAELLKSNNHEVIQIIRENNIELDGLFKKISAFKNLSYSKESIDILRKQIKIHGKPKIAHIHNIFPLWTYSIFDYLKKENIPIVFSLHNYRTIAHNFSIFDKQINNYGLFKNSKLLTKIIFKKFNKKKNLLNNVDRFITHTSFTKDIFVKNGINDDKLRIKPNFTNKSSNKILSIKDKNNALYASRLSKEKGIITLLKALEKIDLDVDIIGGGPLKKKVINNKSNIKYHGELSRDEVLEFIKKSKFLIYPSEWFEIFGMAIIEAFNHGTLVLASKIGSIKNIIQDKVTGILFEPGNVNDLVNKINWIRNNPNKCDQIIKNAKKEFNNNYSSKKNYMQLLKIYNEII